MVRWSLRTTKDYKSKKLSVIGFGVKTMWEIKTKRSHLFPEIGVGGFLLFWLNWIWQRA